MFVIRTPCCGRVRRDIIINSHPGERIRWKWRTTVSFFNFIK